MATYPSRFDRNLGACESRLNEQSLLPYLVLRKRTFGKRQVEPTRDEATIEVAMSNDHDISGSLTLFLPLSMIFTNLLN
jgi:hypothetical protein